MIIFKLQNSTAEVDVTKDVKNWADTELSLSRDELNGAEKFSSTKYEFVGETANKLYNDYIRGSIFINYQLNIYRQNQNWEYQRIYSGKLDFSSIEYDGYTFSIETIPSNFYNQLKANLTTNYDIEYNDIKSHNKLLYDRVGIINQLQYTLGNNYEIRINYDYGNYGSETDMRYYCYPIPIAYIDSQTKLKNQTYSYNNVITELDGGGFSGLIPPSNSNFLQINKKDKSLRISTDFELDIISLGNGEGYEKRATWCDIALVEYSGDNPIKILACTSENIYDENAKHLAYLAWDNGFTDYGVNNMMNKHHINLFANLSDVEPGSNIGLFLISATYGGFYGNNLDCEIYSNRHPKNWYKKGSIMMIENETKGEDKELDCFTTYSILSALVSKIKTDVNVECIIDDTDVPVILLSGENIRQFQNAKIHTSFNDFANFMRTCFGFIYSIEEIDINNYRLRFGKRENLFIDQITKTIDDYNDFNFSQDTSLIYSNISAGYNSKDISHPNGKNEYNTTDEYTTETTITDNSLELVCPYRADSIGFEFFVQEYENQGEVEETKGDDKDDNIFIIAVQKELQNEKYIIDRELSVIGNSSELFSANDGYYTGIKLIAASYPTKDVKLYYMTIERNGDNYICQIHFTAGMNSFAMRKNYIGEIEDKDVDMIAYNPNIGLALFARVNWSILDKSIPTSTQGNKKVYIVNTFLSLFSYGTNSFNVKLHPRYCIERNYLVMPVVGKLNFASSEGNANACIYDNKGGYTYLQSEIKPKDSKITINVIDFSTSDTELPIEKNALIRLNSRFGVFDGYILEANENIGKNQSTNYKLLLKK